MHKKYMFFDIDGTLSSGVIGIKPHIPDETKQTLQDLKNRGHLLAIATGRPYFMCKEIAKEVGIAHLVCNGGNDIYIHGKCRQKESLDQSLVHSLIDQCRKKNIAFCVSLGDDLIRYSHHFDFQKLIEGKHFLGKLIVDRSFTYEDKQIQRMFIDKKRVSELDFHGTLVGSSNQEVYVIVEPDDKFYGILQMMKILDAPMEDIVVFGDGYNDIRMFEQSPLSIAMGNAVKELKCIADFVTHRSDEDGIRYACEHYHWL